MQSGRSPGRSSRPRGLTSPAFLAPLLLCLAGIAGLWFGHEERLRSVPRTSVSWVDPAAARALQVPDWADPRWLERIRSTLATRPPFALDDRAGLAALRTDLGRLSFVARVARCELDSADALAIELVLRVPVACVQAGSGFALVSAEGVLLEGRWPLPPRLGRTFLPVIGPLGDGLLAGARAGDWLAEPEHQDALALALSLWANLSENERAGLGRILIDARTARAASLAEPGLRLELEGARLALFGRPPTSAEPGELPAAAKWRSLARALELFERDPAALDWDLVDLRWDRPDIALRRVPELAAVTLSPGPLPRRSGRVRAPPDDSGPRVR